MPIKEGADQIFHPAFLQSLNQLDNFQVRNVARGNPHAWLQQQGINLPPDAQVTITEGSWSFNISLGWGLISITVSGGK